MADTTIASLRTGAGAALLGLGACLAPGPPEATSELSTFTTEPNLAALALGPNDVIAFSVYGRPELCSPPEGARVTLEGDLMMPLVGPVRVAGLNERQAHERITAAYAAYYLDPRVTLNVVERGATVFHVLGEVTQPGPKPMDRPLTALEAVALGGAIEDGADKKRVTLIRRHGEELEVHEFSQARPDARGLVQVLPGDVLFVGQTGAGAFEDRVSPYLQGLGFTLAQIASLIIITDRDR